MNERAILLVRHGETDGNARRILQVPGTPLSARGIVQAQRLAERLAAWPIGAILSSDLVRASMTAECIARATGARLELDSLLQERNFGDLRGKAYSELAENPFAEGYVPPGGESWEDLHVRTDAAWKRILEKFREARRGHLVVVSHGLVCHSLVTRRLAFAEGVCAPPGFANTSLTWIEPESPWRVRLANCIAHLEGFEADAARGAAPA